MPDAVTLLIVGAAAKRRVETKAIELREAEELGEKQSKEVEARLKVQRRIGEHILSVMCSGRTIFGQVCGVIYQ
jgi:hypothetical protein